MSTDTAQPVKRTPLKLPNNQETIAKLVAELEDIFAKDKLGNHPQLVFKMNEDLEIPITALYKEKKVLAITTNLALIREALKSTTNAIYDPKKDVVRPNIKAQKNILIINHIDDNEKERLLSVLSESPEYKKKISENFFDSAGGYSLTLQSEEDAEKLCTFLKQQSFKSPKLEILVEQENLYLSILQKAQDAMRFSYQPYGYGYGQIDPSYYYQNYYYFANMYQGGYYPPGYGYDEYGPQGGKPYGKKGRGSANYDDYDNQDYYDDQGEEGEGEERKSPTEEYGSKGHGGRGGKNKKKGHGGAHKQHKEYEKKPYRKSEAYEVSAEKKEEIIKRTRINSENFPPLSKEAAAAGTKDTKEEKGGQKSNPLKHGPQIIHVQKSEIIKAFEALQKAGTLKMNPALEKFKEEEVPVLEKKGELNLEVIQPKVIVREQKQRKRTMTEDSPAQGGMNLGELQQKLKAAAEQNANKNA